LRDENQKQNSKIAHLEQVVNSQDKRMDEKIIKELDHRMADVTAQYNNSNPPYSSGKSRQKRPYRLLPLKNDDGRPGGDGNEISNQLIINRPSKFYGPPTNCSDLSRLGYTLNGFYIVRKSDDTVGLTINRTDAIKLEAIFCAFEQPEGIFNPSSVEKRVAQLKLDGNKSASGGVHFYAHMIQSNSDVAYKGNLAFGAVLLNMGSAFNKKTGIFIAPKNGVYHFVFKGTTVRKDAGRHILVVLHLNDKDLAATIPSGDLNVIAATVKLNKGDRIYLKTRLGSLYVRGDTTTSFSGSLLEELDQ